MVAALAILFYKLAMRLIPRVLQWHLPEPTSAPNYQRAQARVKRRSTAITLVRNVLRYMIFTIVVLFIVSIFLRDALPTVAGASILVAVIGFGAQNLVRDIIAGFFILLRPVRCRRLYMDRIGESCGHSRRVWSEDNNNAHPFWRACVYSQWLYH